MVSMGCSACCACSVGVPTKIYPVSSWGTLTILDLNDGSYDFDVSGDYASLAILCVCQVLGTKCVVPSTWYQILGTKYLGATRGKLWYLKHGLFSLLCLFGRCVLV